VSQPKTMKKQASPKHWQSLATFAGIVVFVVGIGVVLSVIRNSGSSSSGLIRGLPRTPDYHSLLVSPSDPRRLVLGTH
jgi:hypothetical protein